MNSWIQNNFTYAVLFGIIAVIVGGVITFKADNKFGYLIWLGGLIFILYSMRVIGIV